MMADPVALFSYLQRCTLDNQWNRFEQEIKTQNRFVLSDDSMKFIREWVAFLCENAVKTMDTQQKLYRGRIAAGTDLWLEEDEMKKCKKDNISSLRLPHQNKRIRGFHKMSDIGAPPSEKAQSNRASARGIPFIYLATNEYTAVAENRPSIRDIVSVSTFSPKRELHVIHFPLLMQELENSLNSIQEISEQEKLRVLVEKLCLEFSKPVRRNDSDISYLPTQFLADYIRQNGRTKAGDQIDGLLYPSLQSHCGENVVLFDQQIVKLSDEPETIVRILDIEFVCQELNDQQHKVEKFGKGERLAEEEIDSIKCKIK